VTTKKTNVDIKGVLDSLEDTAKETIPQTNMNTDTKVNTTDSIDTKVNTKFVLKKKVDSKTNKKAFNVYMLENLIKNLDQLGKKSGYSRNELINMMCEYCIQNVELIDK